MKRRKNFLKEAGVLLIVVFMVLSTVAVTANTNDDTQPVLVSPESPTVNKHVIPQTFDGIVVWDNGMNYDALLTALYDPNEPRDAYPADDFHFEEDTEVCDVHWIGGYWGVNYQQGACMWCIAFYYDDGTGTKPGTLVQDPHCYEWEEIEKVLIEDDGNTISYELSVDLPHNKLFEGCQKYWISIWAENCEVPPIAGWGFHESPILLHEAVFKSVFYGYPQWTDTSTVLGYPIDMCFQLTQKEDCSKLCCDGTLKWSNIKPGEIVTGTFEVWNCGCECSYLCWVVDSWPAWGRWTFNPSSGTIHSSENVTVQVTVDTTGLAQEETFTGKVIIKNCNNPNETCEIDVTLTTPRTRSVNTPFLNWLQNHLNMFPILIQILLRLGLN